MEDEEKHLCVCVCVHVRFLSSIHAAIGWKQETYMRIYTNSAVPKSCPHCICLLLLVYVKSWQSFRSLWAAPEVKCKLDSQKQTQRQPSRGPQISCFCHQRLGRLQCACIRAAAIVRLLGLLGTKVASIHPYLQRKTGARPQASVDGDLVQQVWFRPEHRCSRSA